MNALDDLIDILCCPKTRARLRRCPKTLIATGKPRHRYTIDKKYVVLDPPPDSGKYEDRNRAQRYAAVQAFGYATMRSGGAEPVYRTAAALTAEALVAGNRERPIIVDCGCGVGRVAADASTLAPHGFVLALDASAFMLDMAAGILLDRGVVTVPGPVPVRRTEDDTAYEPVKHGFHPLKIRGRGLTNVLLAHADAERLPVKPGVADIALSVNVVDRLPHGPGRACAECYRILRPGGHLIMLDPFNWASKRLWRRYPDLNAVLRRVRSTGFRVKTFFDNLPYREIKDARGFTHVFDVAVIHAVKPNR